MWNLLRSWWHDGETPGAIVYRQSWWAAVFAFSALAALFWFVPPTREWYLLLLAAAVGGRGLAERRRAILFRGDTFSLRPPLGKPVSFNLSDFTGVEPCAVMVPFFLKPAQVKGLLLRRREGPPVRVPLDFPGRREVAERLSAALVGRPLPAPGAGQATRKN